MSFNLYYFFFTFTSLHHETPYIFKIIPLLLNLHYRAILTGPWPFIDGSLHNHCMHISFEI